MHNSCINVRNFQMSKFHGSCARLFTGNHNVYTKVIKRGFPTGGGGYGNLPTSNGAPNNNNNFLYIYTLLLEVAVE